MLQLHPSGGEGVSPVQGESIRRRHIKPEYRVARYPVYLTGQSCILAGSLSGIKMKLMHVS